MTQARTTLDQLPETRGALLRFIKAKGNTSLADMAAHLGMTREAVRQQLAMLEQDGWVRRAAQHKSTGQGRPATLFALTPAGDHLFPKFYDVLTVELLDTLAETLGPDALRRMLASLTDKQVAHWQNKLDGLPLAARIEALKGFYFEQDPFTHVERDAQGYLLVERNCPYLNLAMQRPQLCSVTVSTLSRLLGVRVKREAKFQNGDQHCAFRVLADQPVAADYQFEFEQESAPVGGGN